MLDAWTMGEQRPTDASTVHFPAGGAPVFAVALTRDESDVLRDERRMLTDLCTQLQCPLEDDGWEGGGVDFSTARSRALAQPGLAFSYWCALGTLDHEACSLPLGGAVVDTTGELRDVPRVFVAGPCAFPRAGAANPSLTTLALSRSIAAGVHARIAPRMVALPAAGD